MGNALSDVMRDFMEDRTEPIRPLHELRITRGSVSSLPVKPSANEWSVTTAPRTLVRSYDFEDHARFVDFMSEILAHESETGHHARIECEYPRITVSLRTHDLDDVTELDREHASMCDKIYRDVLDYGYGSEADDYF